MSRLLHWRAVLYRWRRWLIAAAIVVLIRVLLPVVLERVIAAQASKALHADVSVGDVDLGLLRGYVALKDVAVRVRGAPPDAAPLVGWKTFAVDLRWLPLFHKTVQLEEVLLDAPRLSLTRLKDGGLNLTTLLPKGAPEPTPAPSPAAAPAAPGWAFGIDRVVLRTGGVHFQDFMMPGSEPVDVQLPAVEVTDIELRPGLYGQPARASIELKVDEGVLRIEANATMRADGIGVETRVMGERLPLGRSRLYIPKVGWSDLRGTLSLDLTHAIDTNGSRDEVRGGIGLQDVSVRVPGFAGGALAWRSLSVQVDPVDLVAQQITVAKVDLDGLTLPIRTGGDAPLPLLRALLAKPTSAATAAAPAADATPTPAASTTTEATPTPTGTPAAEFTPTLEATPAAPASPDTSGAPAAPAKPWHWRIAAAHLTDAKLPVLYPSGRMEVGVAADVSDLAGEGDQPAAVKVGLGIADGKLDIDGKLRLDPLGFAGHVVIDKLNLPELLTAAGPQVPAQATEILPAARLGLDLTVDTGSLAPTPGALNVRGTLTLADAQVAPPAPAGMKIGLQSLTLGVDQLHLDGLLGGKPAANRGDLDLRARLALGGLRLAQAEQPTIDLQSLQVGIDQLHLVGLLAKQPAPDRGDTDLRGTIALAGLRLQQPEQPEIDVSSLDVGVDALHVAGLLAPAGPHQGDVQLKGRLSVGEGRVTAPGAKQPAASVKTIALSLDDVSAPGLLAKAAAGETAGTPGAITVRGKLSLVEPRAVAANPKEFSLGVKSIDVGFDDVQVPNPKDPHPGPLQVHLGDVRIAQPNVQLTRTAGGIVLPAIGGSQTPPAAAAPAVSPAPAASPSASPSIDVSLATFQLSRGRIAFTDRAVKPFYSGVLSPLDVELKGVHFPELAARAVRADATLAPSGRITARGSMGPAGGTVDVQVENLALTPFAPYATAYSAYGITDGSLSLDTKASFTPGGYKADTSIRLHQLEIGGAQGETVFQEHFGIPLGVALALLKDMSGNITLDVPIEADREGMKVGIGTIVAGALRSALVGALASPLKLIGMVLPGSKEPAAAPPEIAFRAGRAEPAPHSAEQIKQVGAFLSSRPGMGVTLEALTSTRDVRWLREHALLEALSQPQGFFTAVRNIGQGGKRERISAALAARQRDEAGELSDEDSKTLDEWLDERPAPTAAQLHALAEARLTKIESLLHDDYGVDGSRITRSVAAGDPIDDPPAVRLTIGVLQQQ